MKTISELLTGREIVALLGSATALEAARSMHDNRVGGVLVVDGDRRPAGIFTERDLATRVVAPGLDPAKTAIEEVMTRGLFTASPEDRLHGVAREMQSRHIRHLPVVEDGVVVGLLSLRDLLREILAIKDGEVRALTDYIQGPTEPGS